MGVNFESSNLYSKGTSKRESGGAVGRKDELGNHGMGYFGVLSRAVYGLTQEWIRQTATF